MNFNFGISQMARARNIKPGFFTNDVLGELDPLARLLFIGLWCQADRTGRLEDRPKRLKAEVLPYDNCDVNSLTQCLHDASMVQRYVVDGKRYIQIINFTKHQNPHIKEQGSTIPAPCKHGTCTEVATLIPDSGFLIPSTLIQEKTLSGKPDIDDELSKLNMQPKKKLSEACAEVLQFLNAKAGRNYRPVKANIELIAARIKEGATVDECRQVIAKKCREWIGDPKQEIYLRPATLFNRTKFAQYQGELT